MDLKWIWDINIVAGYAAVMSTGVFLWDMYKWWHGGAAFKITHMSNAILIGGYPEDSRTFVYITASNIGSMTTTVTGVVILVYKSRLHKLLNRKPLQAAVVVHSLETHPIPYELKSGTQFISRCEQTEDLVKWSREAVLYMGVSHSLSKKPLLTRVAGIVT